MRRPIQTVTLLISLLLPAAGVSAQTPPPAAPPAPPVPPVSPVSPTPLTVMPGNTTLGMVLDLGQLRNSNVLQGIYQRLDARQQQDITNKLDGLSNAAGINLRTDLGRLSVFSTSLNMQDAGLILELADIQTNLEGLLLAADGYESFEHGPQLIHSATGENQQRYYAALVPTPPGSDPGSARGSAPGSAPGSASAPASPVNASGGRGTSGGGMVVLSVGKARLLELVDAVQAGGAMVSPEALRPGEFLHLWVNQLPADVFADQPKQSQIAKLIDSIELVGIANGEATELGLTLQMADDARARQIYQLVMGGKALVEMAAQDDADAAKLADLLAYLTVTAPQGDQRVTLTTRVTDTDLEGFLNMLQRSGALQDLPLDLD